MKKLIFAVVAAALVVATISRADGVVRFTQVYTGIEYDSLVYDRTTGCTYYRMNVTGYGGGNITPLLGKDGLPSCNGLPPQQTN